MPRAALPSAEERAFKPKAGKRSKPADPTAENGPQKAVGSGSKPGHCASSSCEQVQNAGSQAQRAKRQKVPTQAAGNGSTTVLQPPASMGSQEKLPVESVSGGQAAAAAGVACETSSSDFKENLWKQQPSITTRHLQTGERNFVCKIVNTSGGVRRMLEALLGRPLLAWKLAFRTAQDDSDDDCDNTDADNFADAAAGMEEEELASPEGEDTVVGLAVACSGETCWFMPVAAFPSAKQYWDACREVLVSSDALKVTYSSLRMLSTLLHHSIDLAHCGGLGIGGGVEMGHEGEGGSKDCRLWDVAVAVWASQDAGESGGTRGVAGGDSGKPTTKSKKKKRPAAAAAASIQSLHKSCMLYAPQVAGRKERNGAHDPERVCAIQVIQTLCLHVALCGKPRAQLGLVSRLKPDRMAETVGVGVGGRLDAFTQRALSQFEMPLLPHLARMQHLGTCLDLSRLSDMTGVLRQRSERLQVTSRVNSSMEIERMATNLDPTACRKTWRCGGAFDVRLLRGRRWLRGEDRWMRSGR